MGPEVQWAIILAGSYVWRADSLEAACPRALLPVANAPMVHYTLAWLRAGGLRAATLCSNDAALLLGDCLQDGTAAGIELFYYEDRVPRGPAGSVCDAALATPADPFIVVEGAIIPELNLTDLLRAHRRSNAAATVVVHGAHGDNDEAEANQSPIGIYVFGRSALARVPRAGFQDIKEGLIPRLHGEGETVVAYAASGTFPRVRGLASYLAAQVWALERIYARELTRDRYEWRRGAYVHHSARLAERARVVPPVMIGPESRVEDEAVLVGPCVLGGRCVVGRGSIIERSVLWDACTVGPQVVIDQAVLTAGVLVASGVTRQCIASPLVAGS